jgi:hypothetical protein
MPGRRSLPPRDTGLERALHVKFKYPNFDCVHRSDYRRMVFVSMGNSSRRKKL